MKNCFFIFLFVLSTLNYRAQNNLVPNSSFEIIDSCYSGIPIEWAQPWFSPNGATPDIFNNCQFGYPSSGLAYQFARTGGSYVGMFVPYSSMPSMEYIATEMSESLKAGRKYNVKCYISLADACSRSTNSFGMYLSEMPVSAPSGDFIVATPQVTLTSASSISKTDWVEVSGEYIALGGEKIITIGCFNSLDTVYIGSGFSYIHEIYLLIDDVSVICLDCDFIPNIFSPNNDNQNDYIDFSNLNLVEEIVDIYNRWGTKVFQSSVNVTKWDGRDLKGNDCAEGVYYYVFHYSEFINKELDKKGFIQLVR